MEAVRRSRRRPGVGGLSPPASATEPWRHAAAPGCPGPPWRPAASGRAARRTGSRGRACRTIRSASAPDPSPTSRSVARSAVRTTRVSISDWVPSKTAQSVRRKPAKSGPRIRPMAATRWRLVRRGQRGEVLDVGRDRVCEPEVDTTREVQAALAVASERPAHVRRGRMRSGQRQRPLGPQRQRPLGVTDATPVEREIHSEVACSGAVKGPGRAADGDLTEDRYLDGTGAHMGNGRVSPAESISTLEHPVR